MKKHKTYLFGLFVDNKDSGHSLYFDVDATCFTFALRKAKNKIREYLLQENKNYFLSTFSLYSYTLNTHRGIKFVGGIANGSKVLCSCTRGR